MDVVLKFEEADERKDIDVMCELCIENVLFDTPQWVTNNKKDLRAKLKKEYASDTTKFYGETPWEELKPGKKFTRTLKVKLMLGLITMKVRQTYRVNGDGLIKSMTAKRI